MNKKTILIVIGIIVILVVIGLFYINNSSTKNSTIKIGGAFALTGFANTWGEADKNGALMAVEEANSVGGINGKKIELIIEDTKSDNKDSLSAVLKLIEVDKVDAIIGPTWMDTYLSSAPLSDEKNIVMMEPSAAITSVKSEKNYKNIFSTYYRSDNEFKKLPSYLSKNKIEKVAIIITNDIFWNDATNKFKENAKENGIEILDEYKVNPEDTDLRTPITKIKEAKPDAVVFGFNSEQNLAGFLKQRQEIYPDSVLFTQESIEEFISKKDFNGLFTNVNFIAPKVFESDFTQKYKNKFNIDPVFSASNSYDATKILLQAIDKTKSTTTEDIRNYINSNEFDTITFGKTRFDDIGGVSGGSFVIKSVENGTAKEIAVIE